MNVGLECSRRAVLAFLLFTEDCNTLRDLCLLSANFLDLFSTFLGGGIVNNFSSENQIKIKRINGISL